jgi:hypothetical protein
MMIDGKLASATRLATSVLAGWFVNSPSDGGGRNVIFVGVALLLVASEG